MYKKLIISLISLILVGFGLSGCTTDSPKTEEEAKPNDEVSDSGNVSFDMSQLSTYFSRPTGDLAMGELTPLEEIDSDMEAQIDRSMRAFTPPDDSPIQNDAISFYYYDQLTFDQQSLYDGLYYLCTAPYEENYVLFSSPINPNNTEFREDLSLVYYSLLYDHPELFWLYNSNDTDLLWQSNTSAYNNGYAIYFSFSNPITDFEEKMENFNDAVEEFLDDIDLDASEEEIAKEIHDKLIETVTYDYDVYENHTYSSYAHTAYGALVENSEGIPNYAVCDGYALAYEYLAQQAGLEATVILGNAGSTEQSAGGHAWSMVKINGEWKEVDSCWDDMTDDFDELDEYVNNEKIDGYEYYSEMLNDEEYREKVFHYLYSLSTPAITNYFVDEEEFTYFTKDGKYSLSLPLVGDSVHIRWNAEDGPQGSMVDVAPTAK